MDNRGRNLLTYILKIVSESETHCVKLPKLYETIEHNFNGTSESSTNIKLLSEEAIKEGKRKGLLTCTDSCVCMPSNFLANKPFALRSSGSVTVKKEQTDNKHKKPSAQRSNQNLNANEDAARAFERLMALYVTTNSSTANTRLSFYGRRSLRRR